MTKILSFLLVLRILPITNRDFYELPNFFYHFSETLDRFEFFNLCLPGIAVMRLMIEIIESDLKEIAIIVS